MITNIVKNYQEFPKILEFDSEILKLWIIYDTIEKGTLASSITDL